MNIAEREQQILRVKAQRFQSELNSGLEAALRSEVVVVAKATIEAALVEELAADLATREGKRPRRTSTPDTSSSRTSDFSGVSRLARWELPHPAVRNCHWRRPAILARFLGTLN